MVSQLIFNLTNNTKGFYQKLDTKLSFLRENDFNERFPNVIYDYVTPVNGWHWFNDIEEARAFFNLPDCRVEPAVPYFDIDPLIFYPEFRPTYGLPPQE